MPAKMNSFVASLTTPLVCRFSMLYDIMFMFPSKSHTVNQLLSLSFETNPSAGREAVDDPLADSALGGPGSYICLLCLLVHQAQGEQGEQEPAAIGHSNVDLRQELVSAGLERAQRQQGAQELATAGYSHVDLLVTRLELLFAGTEGVQQLAADSVLLDCVHAVLVPAHNPGDEVPEIPQLQAVQWRGVDAEVWNLTEALYLARRVSWHWYQYLDLGISYPSKPFLLRL